MKKAIWFLLVIAPALVLGCSEDPKKARLSPTRGIILISIDTLRADHLGTYGYTRSTSPFIDSLAERGVVFENAFVQLHGTLPSHMSIFTGLYPWEHGVYPPDGVLSPEIRTLPELFRDHGFKTGGHSEGGYVDGSYGFDRGFDEFGDEARKSESDAERTFARGIEFLRRLGPDDRFFVFLHTYTVHDPYFPLEQYASLYWPGVAPDTFRPTGRNLVDVNRGRREVTSEEVEYFKALYDASINYVDDVVRDFFSELEALGLSDEVTVVLTSDHGEEFLDHGRLVHEQIYPEQLRVPLIFVHPELTGGRRPTRIVESIDIAPTLSDIAGIEPLAEISGESLVPLLLGNEATGGGETPQALAEGMMPPAHTLLRQSGDRFHQLILTRAAPDGKSGWISKTISFDLAPGKIDLRAVSFKEPRQMRISIDGELPRTIEIHPGRWTPVPVEVPGGESFRRVALSVDRCLHEPPDPRCLGFRVEGHPLPSFELFDLVSDPTSQENISRSRAELTRRLARGLLVHTEGRGKKASAGSQELDPELTQRLRALGYLD